MHSLVLLPFCMHVPLLYLLHACPRFNLVVHGCPTSFFQQRVCVKKWMALQSLGEHTQIQFVLY